MLKEKDYQRCTINARGLRRFFCGISFNLFSDFLLFQKESCFLMDRDFSLYQNFFCNFGFLIFNPRKKINF